MQHAGGRILSPSQNAHKILALAIIQIDTHVVFEKYFLLVRPQNEIKSFYSKCKNDNFLHRN